MHTIHVDCSVLSDDELQSMVEFIAEQPEVAKVRIQTFFMDEEESEDEPFILNVDVPDSHWSRIILGDESVQANAARWLARLLIQWGDDKRDRIIGYDETQNIIVLGEPEAW